jgi:hypothetical protein
MGRFHRQVKLAWCLELLGMAVPPQPDTAPDDTDPTPPSNREAMVTPTRVSPRCGTDRIVAVVEFPPMLPAERIKAGVEQCLGIDSS